MAEPLTAPTNSAPASPQDRIAALSQQLHERAIGGASLEQEEEAPPTSALDSEEEGLESAPSAQEGHSNEQEEEPFVSALDEEEEEEKPIKAPAARARVLENENRALREQLAQFSGMLQMLQNQQVNSVSNDEEELERELNPLGGLESQINELKAMLARNEEEKQYQALQGQIMAFEGQIDGQIKAFASKDPENYKAAMTHLSSVALKNNQARYPHKSDEEHAADLVNSLADLRRQAVLDGHNPGKFLYELAKNYGYTPGKKANSAIAVNAKKQIGKKNAAARKNPSIAGGESSAPKTVTSYGPPAAPRINASGERVYGRGIVVGSGNRVPTLAELSPNSVIQRKSR